MSEGRESYSWGQGLMLRTELLGRAEQSKQNKLGEGSREEPVVCWGADVPLAWAWLGHYKAKAPRF